MTTIDELPMMSVEDLVTNYKIVQDSGDVIVVSAVNQLATIRSEPNYVELGHTGMTAYSGVFREEYNNDLRGRLGAQKYDRMRRSDAQIATSLRMIKSPIYAARWYVNPASSMKRDQKIAGEVWDNFTKYLSCSFSALILEALNFLDFGWYTFEPVYTVQNGQIIWKKFASRHPLDLAYWFYSPVDGGPVGATFWGPDGTETFIPMAMPNGQTKLLTFTLDKEGGDMQGRSLLRAPYKNWYYKENLLKVDAIQKERHGIGIPIIKLPEGFNANDVALANELGRNLRVNEKAHVALPVRFEVEMLDLKGQPVDVIKSINYHDSEIMRNVLAPFAFSERGITSVETQELFMKGARFIASIVADTFNKWAIPDWVRFNYGPNVDPPELKVRRIGDTIDWRTISFAIRNLIGAQVIKPDDPLEVYFREEMDLPLGDPSTIREPPTPQAPAGQEFKGTPKQSTASNMQNGPGKSNTGGDGGSTSK